MLSDHVGKFFEKNSINYFDDAKKEEIKSAWSLYIVAYTL